MAGLGNVLAECSTVRQQIAITDEALARSAKGSTQVFRFDAIKSICPSAYVKAFGGAEFRVTFRYNNNEETVELPDFATLDTLMNAFEETNPKAQGVSICWYCRSEPGHVVPWELHVEAFETTASEGSIVRTTTYGTKDRLEVFRCQRCESAHRLQRSGKTLVELAKLSALLTPVALIFNLPNSPIHPVVAWTAAAVLVTASVAFFIMGRKKADAARQKMVREFTDVLRLPRVWRLIAEAYKIVVSPGGRGLQPTVFATPVNLQTASRLARIATSPASNAGGPTNPSNPRQS